MKILVKLLISSRVASDNGGSRHRPPAACLIWLEVGWKCLPELGTQFPWQKWYISGGGFGNSPNGQWQPMSMTTQNLGGSKPGPQFAWLICDNWCMGHPPKQRSAKTVIRKDTESNIKSIGPSSHYFCSRSISFFFLTEKTTSPYKMTRGLKIMWSPWSTTPTC